MLAATPGRMKGRDNESSRIRAANKAVAVVKLMDGQLSDWVDFLEPDKDDLESLPRRMLKAGHRDVKRRVSKDIKRFCETNFFDMTESKLVELYDHVKVTRGLELPLNDFQEQFARFRPEALSSNPLHSTVRISLWGLKFEFPEKYLADDVETALLDAQRYDADLKKYEKKQHRELHSEEHNVAHCIRLLKFNARMAVLSCFNLVEAYFNGIAWEFLQRPNLASLLSKSNKNLLQDASGTSLRDKIIKYPKIIRKDAIFCPDHDPVKSFLAIVKPFRDSLVHASPFSAPERFGGYDKLRTMYRIDVDTAYLAAHLSVEIIGITHRNVSDAPTSYPDWLQSLARMLQIAEVQRP